MIEINTNREQLNVDFIQQFLTRSYWAKGITKEQVQTCIDRSENFGVYINGKQIGYARVLTDFVRFAYLLDVFIIEEHRGKGYSKKLMDYIFNNPKFGNIKVWKLGTLDAHELYKKYGFTQLQNPERVMERIKNKK